MSTQAQWFYRPRPRPEALVRLVCFPYAGAGAAVYRLWPEELPVWVEVCAMQLPGRGWRIREAPLADLEQVVAASADAVDELADKPLALFGHSFGSWCAFGVARRLAAASKTPIALFVSGRNAPAFGATTPDLHHLPDHEFVEQIIERYGGIPEEILAEPDLLELLLPALRADVRALETSTYRAADPLDCPITAFHGDGDRTLDADGMAAWGDETRRKFRLRALPGGHFFIETAAARLLQLLGDELAILVDPERSRRA